MSHLVCVLGMEGRQRMHDYMQGTPHASCCAEHMHFGGMTSASMLCGASQIPCQASLGPSHASGTYSQQISNNHLLTPDLRMHILSLRHMLEAIATAWKVWFRLK